MKDPEETEPEERCEEVRIAADQRSLLVWLYRSLPWVRISRLFGRLAERSQPRPLVLLAILGTSHNCYIATAGFYNL